MFPSLNDFCCTLSGSDPVNVHHCVSVCMCVSVVMFFNQSSCMGLCRVAWSWCYIHSHTLQPLEMFSCSSDGPWNACRGCLYTWMRRKLPLKDMKTRFLLCSNNLVSVSACGAACLPSIPEYDDVCLQTFTWPLWNLPPQAELPVESQMKPGVWMLCAWHVIHSDCDSSLSVFYSPPRAQKGEAQMGPPTLPSASCAMVSPPAFQLLLVFPPFSVWNFSF